jgi:hypothetical protein
MSIDRQGGDRDKMHQSGLICGSGILPAQASSLSAQAVFRWSVKYPVVLLFSVDLIMRTNRQQ